MVVVDKIDTQISQDTLGNLDPLITRWLLLNLATLPGAGQDLRQRREDRDAELHEAARVVQEELGDQLPEHALVQPSGRQGAGHRRARYDRQEPREVHQRRDAGLHHAAHGQEGPPRVRLSGEKQPQCRNRKVVTCSSR